MKYKNITQQARKKYLKQQSLSEKEQAVIDRDFRGKDYAYYQSIKEDKILLSEQYAAEATFRKIEQGFGEKYTRLSLLKYAAVVVLLICVTFSLYYRSNYPKVITASTLYGEKKFITLPDGSTVVLNSLSSISYPKKMKGNVREIILEGEALFDVIKNTEKTFVVKSRDLEVKVLGTKFNVSAYTEDEEIITSLYEGSVIVALNSGKTFKLQPGEKAVYNKRFNSLDVESLEEEVQSWVDCSFCFYQKSLKEILKILEREKNISFTVSDQVNKELRITANFSQDESVEDILDILGQSGDFTYERSGDLYIINIQEYEVE